MMQINTSCYMFGISTCPETCFQNMPLTNHGSPKNCVNKLSITRVPQNSFRGKVYYYHYGEKLLGGYAPQQLFPIMVIIYFSPKGILGQAAAQPAAGEWCLFKYIAGGSMCALVQTHMLVFVHHFALGSKWYLHCTCTPFFFQWLLFYKTRMLKNCRRSNFFRFYTSASLARRPPTGPQD